MRALRLPTWPTSSLDSSARTRAGSNAANSNDHFITAFPSAPAGASRSPADSGARCRAGPPRRSSPPSAAARLEVPCRRSRRAPRAPGARRGRSHDHVAALERRGEVARDQAADLLRLQVISVVIAVRQHVGADEDPELHLGAEALCARAAIHVGEIAVLLRAVT